MVTDNFNQDWINRFPKHFSDITSHLGGMTTPFVAASKQEFDLLKKEVEELKILLLAAKRFDKETGQPDCEMADKVELLKKIATLFDVDMKEVFGKEIIGEKHV